MCELHVADPTGLAKICENAPRVDFGRQMSLHTVIKVVKFWDDGFEAYFKILEEYLQFPNAVVLNVVGRRNTQMRAKERK